jgi:hypothetical protein
MFCYYYMTCVPYDCVGMLYVDDSKTTSMCRDEGVTACEGNQRLLFLSENVSEARIIG